MPGGIRGDENVSSFAVRKSEARERRFRDSTDRAGNIVVVEVSAAETKPVVFNDASFQRTILDDDDEENAKDESKLLSRGNCETDKIFPRQQQRTRANRSPRCESAGVPTLLCIDGRLVDVAASRVKPKIPRPANAFMLFANEWRRKLAAENPRESNKDISVRLGIFWKNMSKDMKEKYFALAREVDKEHKRKYPGTRAVS